MDAHVHALNLLAVLLVELAGVLPQTSIVVAGDYVGEMVSKATFYLAEALLLRTLLRLHALKRLSIQVYEVVVDGSVGSGSVTNDQNCPLVSERYVTAA